LISHYGPSPIDIRTLQRSGPLPLVFLRGVGLPDALIDYLPSLLNQSIQLYSCFISVHAIQRISTVVVNEAKPERNPRTHPRSSSAACAPGVIGAPGMYSRLCALQDPQDTVPDPIII
jgi:hypothetical protein